MEDGFEEVDVVALDLAALEECRGVEGAEDAFDLGHGGAEQG